MLFSTQFMARRHVESAKIARPASCETKPVDGRIRYGCASQSNARVGVSSRPPAAVRRTFDRGICDGR